MSEPRHIIIVDPDLRERERAVALIQAIADELGEIVIHSASEGREALLLIETHHPALVICEVLLPGMSGLALLRRLRRAREVTSPPTPRPPAPHFILVTTMARESDRYWGLRNGAHGYVMKPYEDDLLQARIREVLVAGDDALPEKLAAL